MERATAVKLNGWQPLLAKTTSWWEAALSFFYPNTCQICLNARAMAAEGYVCTGCRARPGAVQRIQAPFCARCGLPFPGDITGPFECSNCRELEFDFRYARAAVAAKGLVLDVIHRYKYSGAVWFEPFLGQLFAEVAAPVLQAEEWDWIVPVPLHPVKRREREFNQAEQMAKWLHRATQIPVVADALKRVTPTRTQTLLSRAERAANVSRAFALRPGREVQGRKVILVDDVFTTGATTQACAKALRRNGAEEICVWTVARGL